MVGSCRPREPSSATTPWITSFAATAGFPQSADNPTKLQGDDIAAVVKAALEMDDRGFIPELTVFATNPKD